MKVAETHTPTTYFVILIALFELQFVLSVVSVWHLDSCARIEVIAAWFQATCFESVGKCKYSLLVWVACYWYQLNYYGGMLS